MLDPSQRRHLVDALRPPPGHELDLAIGTTYSLDLLALLTAPLAFTFFDYEGEDGQHAGNIDPLALLEALRRYAERILICCDAGRITVPRTAQLLFSTLEPCVYEVGAPNGGVFHPKLWVLRFVGPTGDVRYRLLCLSRNLTFDRSWDTALALDGELRPEADVQPANEPLAAFVASLPGLVVGAKSTNALAAAVQKLAAELPRVVFEPPHGFDALAFHPLGIPAIPSNPFVAPVDRTLVISPFVTAQRLQALAKRGKNNMLVARLEELQVQPVEVLRRFAAVYTLSESADLEEPVTEGEDAGTSALAGLHAKLYVSDAGDRAHIWTGSANATDAGFHQNVEFLTQLSGARSVCGVDAVLGVNRPTGLRALLEPFDPAGAGQACDELQANLDALVETWQRAIARLGATAYVEPGSSPEQFTVRLVVPAAALLTLPETVTVTCWPTTRGAGSAALFHPDQPAAAIFNDLSYEGLTSFVAFAITAREGDTYGEARFVLNLPLVGAPADRQQRLLRALLQNRSQVLRFLLLLLSDNGAELEGVLRATRALGEGEGLNGDVSSQFFGLPLFEAMVRALDRDPARLDHIARLVDDLRSSPETSKLLPDDFDAIWAPVRATAEGLRR